MGVNKQQIINNSSTHSSHNLVAYNNAPKIWVTYSEDNPKFGICYMLNSGSTGMKFNDSTCLISNNNFTKIKYYPTLKDPSSA